MQLVSARCKPITLDILNEQKVKDYCDLIIRRGEVNFLCTITNSLCLSTLYPYDYYYFFIYSLHPFFQNFLAFSLLSLFLSSFAFFFSLFHTAKMTGTLRWHSCSTNDFPLKRHKVSKACEACRSKKMRCDGSML